MRVSFRTVEGVIEFLNCKMCSLAFAVISHDHASLFLFLFYYAE